MGLAGTQDTVHSHRGLGTSLFKLLFSVYVYIVLNHTVFFIHSKM